MKSINKILIIAGLLLGVVVAPLAPVAVGASSIADQISQGTKSVDEDGKDANTDDLPKLIQNVVNILLFVLGAIAVIIIIIGGIRYTVSNGDPQAIKGAKDTILYAVVGLIVAILAYAIVNFVVGAFNGD